MGFPGVVNFLLYAGSDTEAQDRVRETYIHGFNHFCP